MHPMINHCVAHRVVWSAQTTLERAKPFTRTVCLSKAGLKINSSDGDKADPNEARIRGRAQGGRASMGHEGEYSPKGNGWMCWRPSSTRMRLGIIRWTLPI